MSTPAADDQDARPPPDPALRAYLAEHDLFCPGCSYNLRGLAAARCPECGLAVSVPVEATDPRQSEADRLAAYLRDHDLICKKCKTNLRGGTSNVCPTCGATYMLQHTAPLYADAPTRPARTRQTTRSGLLVVLVPIVLLLSCIGLSLLFELGRVIEWVFGR